MSKKTYKKCRCCKQAFIPLRPMQIACSVDCARVLGSEKALKDKVKKDRADTKQRKEKLLTKSDWIKKAQKAVNAYVRYRDIGLPCISCKTPIQWDSESTGGVCDAGHYLSIGARVNLRFNLDNIHAQCKRCNNQLGGNAVNYRIGLIEKIGLERVEALESDHTLKKWTIEDLRLIEKEHKEFLKNKP